MATKTENNGLQSKDEPKICKTCNIPFSDIYEYTEHLESKQHIKGVMKKKYGKKYLEAKAKLNENNSEKKTEIADEALSVSDEKHKPVKEVPRVIEKAVEKPVKNSTEKPFKNPVTSNTTDSSSSNEDSEDDQVYTCDVCEKICTGFLSYQLHLAGKKHQKNVKKVALLKEMKDQKMIPVLKDEPNEDSLFHRVFPQNRNISLNIECKVCKKKCVGPEAYKQHCKSASHQKKIATEELMKGMETECLSLTKDPNDDTFAKCDICSKAFSGPLPYMQHMESPSHLKQARYMSELGKIQNLIVSKEEDTKFNCKECGKAFSGPVPFNAHLKSSAHGKMKKKSDLIENLEKKHPELIKTLAAENSDDSDEDDSVMLGCKVCHMVFSGPEAAKDHFTSSKHKKAVKKKAMFKKLKRQQKADKLVSNSGGTKKIRQ